MSRTTHLKRWFTLFSPVVMLAAAAAPIGLIATAQASAQVMSFGGPGGGGPGGRSISKASLDRYSKLLQLDAAQMQAAQALHEAYSANTKAAGKDMAAKMKELNADLKDGDMDVIQNKIPEVMREHAEKTRELEKTFLSDLQALLTPQQSESRWPAVERLRTREQWLRTGVLSGSNVDLTDLVDSMKLPEAERTKLSPTLEQYEQDMDRALQEVAREAEQSKEAGRAARTGGKGNEVVMTFDPESMRDHMKKQRESSARIKDLNQRYARLLAGDLPEELRGKLEEQFKLASFRNVYKETPTARKLAAAEKFEDLTPTQRDRLREISEGYRRQARAASDRWAAAQAQAEADGKFAGGGGGMLFSFGDRDGGQPQDLKEARQARRDLDKKADSDLDNLLNDDQKARLPRVQTSRKGAFGGEDVEMLGDGEGGHAVFVSAIETADDDGSGEGVVVSRSVVVTAHGGEETDATDQPEKKEQKKKDEKKKE